MRECTEPARTDASPPAGAAAGREASPGSGGRKPAAHRWQEELARAVRDPEELLRLLALSPEWLEGARRAARRFPLIAPRPFIARMRRGDPADPLLRQVLPLEIEEREVEGFGPDPLGEADALRAPGLLQKYAGRALLLLSGRCAVHCRYCFRRHHPYDEVPCGEAAWAPALEAIGADPSITEAILSGGDPLLLADEPLGRIVGRLAAIPHLRRLRIHTRLPIVIPSRVTDRLVELLATSRLVAWFVIHANHPRELEGECARSLARLADGGVPLLSQAVLLRAVNDDADTLADLCERLVDLRVRPYYLHQLDPVAGAAHFRVEPARARAIRRELPKRLPGYALPRWVREEPGAPHKIELAESG